MTTRRRVLSVAALVSAIAFVLVAAVALTAVRPPSVRADGGFGTRVPGKHIYDSTGLLTAAETANLENRATAVQRAGTTVVVYLRASNETYDETLSDAASLMNAWDVESKPGAHDGLVTFLNLEPGNLRHGQVALYAGAKLIHGPLPTAEMQRIYQSDILPLLESEQTAQGIGQGLDDVAYDLRHGSSLGNLDGFVRGPLVPLALLLALLSLVLALWAFRWRLRHFAGPYIPPETKLAPAYVGALALGRIRDEQMEATLLDLARRKALVIEPAGPRQVRIRLLDKRGLNTDFERRLWRALDREADGKDIIHPESLAHVPTDWVSALGALRADLERRGWYRLHPITRRIPLNIAGITLMFASLAALTFGLVAQEWTGAIAMLILFAASLATFITCHYLPDTTPEGERLAAVWRGYLRSLNDHQHVAASDEELNEALPLAVAMGTPTRLDDWLRQAGERGYKPIWFSRHTGAIGSNGFYPYWVAFHTSCVPHPIPSTGGSSGSFGGSVGGFGGGAAAGGGGAGGGF